MKKVLLSAALLCGLSSISNAQVSNGLLAHYRFDGNVNDSYNSNDGSLVGTTVSYVTDRHGNINSCISFNSNAYVNLPTGLSDSPERSISLWFITSEPGGLIGHNDGPGTYAPILYIGEDERLHGKYWDGSQGSVSQTNYVLTDSLWHHVVITGDNSGQKLYLDNQLIGTTTVPISTDAFPNTNIGIVDATNWPSPPSNNNIKGAIDDVRLYDTVIDPTTIDLIQNTPAWTPPAYPYASNIVYVNPNATGNNNGASWADAFTDPQDAFFSTVDGNEVWIAQGEYKRNTTDRFVTFGWLTDSIKVYGGFSGNGTETSINERDWDLYPTIFSGDIGLVGDTSDNSYTVFSGPFGSSSDVINYSYIDGIKITGGSADGGNYPNFESVGGGIDVNDYVTHVVLNNIEFYDNYAIQGGAMSFVNEAGPSDMRIELNNIIAHDNSGRSSVVGHFRAFSGRQIDLTITNSLFHNNYALNSLNGQTQDFGTVLFVGANSTNFDFKFINNTVANNSYGDQHDSWGVLRCYNLNSTTSMVAQNNIFYGNGNGNGVNSIMDITDMGASLTKRPFDNVTLRNNILENGHNIDSAIDINNSTNDPLFNDPSNDDFSLSAGSPAIDSGSLVGVQSWVPIVDILGNDRVSGNAVDRGAYEYGSQVSSIEITTKSDIVLYPNPAVEAFSIKADQPINRVNIYSTTGQLVISETKSNISIESLNTGLYHVEIVTGQKTTIKKLVKN